MERKKKSIKRMRGWSLLFQCLFYTGSWVSEKKYQPIVSQIRTHPQVDNLSFHSFFPPPKGRNDTVLIGHSLGGYFALWDAIRFPDRVAGVILLNSHFNSRGVMPYPRIPMEKVNVPVLTILAGKDDRLPIRKAMDDAWEAIQENYFDKYFIINKNHNHFTGITNTRGNVSAQVLEFLDALSTYQFSTIRQKEKHYQRFRPDLFYRFSENAVITSESVNILDAIFRLVLERSVWRFLHFLWFLSSKPDDVLSFLFLDDDHIYLKGKPSDEKHYKELLKEWMRDVPTEIHDIHLQSIHPCILMWLFFSLTPKWEKSKITAPRIILKVDNQTTYYKVPNPRKFFTILPQSSFFDF